jgi:shikimate kinase
MSQQYQKFKISLARNARKNKFTLGSSKKARRRIISNKSHDVYLERNLEESVNKVQLIEQIKLLENSIKETKRNILAEREINLMLKEENANFI